jgi:hypothetical protein
VAASALCGHNGAAALRAIHDAGRQAGAAPSGRRKLSGWPWLATILIGIRVIRVIRGTVVIRALRGKQRA